MSEKQADALPFNFVPRALLHNNDAFGTVSICQERKAYCGDCH